MKRTMTILLAFVVLLFIGCGEVAGGSSSETGNGVVATVENGVVSGKAKKESSLMLYSSDYNAFSGQGFSDTLVPHSDETFSFGLLDSGSYNLYALDNQGVQSLCIQSIEVDGRDSTYKAQFENGGAISGTVTSVDSAVIAGLCLEGMPFIADLETDGRFVFDDVPAGVYVLQAWQYIDAITIEDSTGVIGGDTLGVTVTTPGGDTIYPIIEIEIDLTVQSDSTTTFEQ